MGRSDQLQRDRLHKLEAWRRRGHEPYPDVYARTHRIDEVRGQEAALSGRDVAIAGRIMHTRAHGKTAFADVQAGSGRLQAYARQDELGAQRFEAWGLLEVGDFVGLRGEVFRTYPPNYTRISTSPPTSAGTAPPAGSLRASENQSDSGRRSQSPAGMPSTFYAAPK